MGVSTFLQLPKKAIPNTGSRKGILHFHVEVTAETLLVSLSRASLKMKKSNQSCKKYENQKFVSIVVYRLDTVLTPIGRHGLVREKKKIWL